MKKLIASLLVSLMTCLPLVAEQSPPPPFNFGQVVAALSPEDDTALIAQARQALNLPEAYYDVTIDQVTVDGTTPPTYNSIVVEEVPGQSPDAVALGCAVIIVAVSIVVWGVVIYIIYRVCKKSSPPPPPPPATSTNAPPAHPPIFPPIV